MDEDVPEQPMFQPPELLLSPAAAMSSATIEGSVRPMPLPTTLENIDISDAPPALIRSKSSSGCILPKPSSFESLRLSDWLDDVPDPFLDTKSDKQNYFQELDPFLDTKSDKQNYFQELARLNSELPYHPDDHILSLQAPSPSPQLQELFKKRTNNITRCNELRGSDSELPYHPDDQILSQQALPPIPSIFFFREYIPSIQELIEEYNLASNSDFQQTLPFPPIPQVFFKEHKTASNLRFQPYLKPTPPVVAPVWAPGNVEERTLDDGTTVKTSNPFAPTDLVISSTSHHVPSSLESILHGHSSRPLAIPYHHLQKITDQFSDDRILGQGGSGVVYKGVLENGEIIAVKKIVSSLMPGLQKKFENEVYHLMRLKHPNIVRCVGYCYETRNECLEYNGKLVFAEKAERLLCLEYIPKTSLDKYITDESSGLTWSTRYKIIEGICYGLCHLHVENGKPIIHLDLKPANILLDDGMVSKITDFGLSRLLDQQKTIYTNSLDGTLGYMAPEFIHGGTITPKSDIFSLGVIIMEVVTGHRDYPDVTRTSSDGFINLVLNKWRKRNVLEKSSWFGSLERDCQQIERCIQVGLICVNPDRTKRPPIAKIINMLQGSESINCGTSIETT